MRTIVCDAGPIIHLYEAGCLSLLRRTGDLFLPPRVYDEVHATLDLKDLWPEWLRGRGKRERWSGLSCPFQTIETVNESRARREKEKLKHARDMKGAS